MAEEQKNNAMRGLFNYVSGIKDALLGQSTAVKTNKAVLEQSIQTNSILRDISVTLKEQFEWFKARDKEREFETDTKKQTNVKIVESDGTKKSSAKTKKSKSGGIFGVLEGLMGAVGSIGGVIGGILGGIGLGLTGLAAGLFALGNPTVLFGIGNLTLLIAGLGTAIGLLSRWFGEDIAEFIHNLVVSIGSAFVEVGVLVGENKDMLMEAVDVATHFVDNMVDIFADFLNDISPLIENVVEMFLGFAENIAEIFTGEFGRIVRHITTTFREIVGIVGNVANNLLDSISDIVTQLPRMLNGLSNVLETIFGGIESTLNSLSNVLTVVFTGIQNNVDTIGTNIVNVINSIGTNVENVATSIGNAISNATDSAFDGMSQVINTISDGIQNVMNTMTSNIERLSQIDHSALTATAGSILAISGAMAVFAGSQAGANLVAGGAAVVGDVMDGIRSLFGGGGSTGVYQQLLDFTEMGPRLDNTSQAIIRLAGALTEFAGMDFTGSSGFANVIDDIESALRNFEGGGRRNSLQDITNFIDSLNESSYTVSTNPSRPSATFHGAAAAGAANERIANTIAASNTENISNSFNTNNFIVTDPNDLESSLRQALQTAN